MIRFILTVLFLVLYLTFSLIPFVILWIVGHFDAGKKDRGSLAIARNFFGCCLKISGTRITVLGEENLPTDHAVLFVGNHRSFYDILIGYTLVKAPCGFVSKKEMAKFPILSFWMRNLHCLFLDRENIKNGLKTILTGIEKIKSGISLWIYPEGTRNKQEDELPLLPFKEGSMKIAEKSRCPVVPVAMIHTADVFENHFPKIIPTHVTVWFGDPIDLTTLSKEDQKHSGAYMQNLLTSMVQELKDREAQA